MICNTKIFIGYEKYIFICGGYNFTSNTSRFDMRLINLVTSNYMHDDQQWYYMKILEGFKMPEAYQLNSWEIYSTKLQIFFYGLK